MKTTIQIRTGEFEYIMQEIDADTPETAVEAFQSLQRAYNGGFGIEAKEFNAALDLYLKDYPKKGKGNTEQYIAMSKEQQQVFQELKKHFDRINNKTKNQ